MGSTDSTSRQGEECFGSGFSSPPLRRLVSVCVKLQALVYGILPPTTAIVDYAIDIGNRLLTNSFSVVGAQIMAVSL